MAYLAGNYHCICHTTNEGVWIVNEWCETVRWPFSPLLRWPTVPVNLYWAVEHFSMLGKPPGNGSECPVWSLDRSGTGWRCWIPFAVIAAVAGTRTVADYAPRTSWSSGVAVAGDYLTSFELVVHRLEAPAMGPAVAAVGSRVIGTDFGCHQEQYLPKQLFIISKCIRQIDVT